MECRNSEKKNGKKFPKSTNYTMPMYAAYILISVTVLRSSAGLDVNKIIFFPWLLLQQIMRKLSIACRNMGSQLRDCCVINHL